MKNYIIKISLLILIYLAPQVAYGTFDESDLGRNGLPADVRNDWGSTLRRYAHMMQENQAYALGALTVVTPLAGVCASAWTGDSKYLKRGSWLGLGCMAHYFISETLLTNDRTLLPIDYYNRLVMQKMWNVSAERLNIVEVFLSPSIMFKFHQKLKDYLNLNSSKEQLGAQYCKGFNSTLKLMLRPTLGYYRAIAHMFGNNKKS